MWWLSACHQTKCIAEVCVHLLLLPHLENGLSSQRKITGSISLWPSFLQVFAVEQGARFLPVGQKWCLRDCELAAAAPSSHAAYAVLVLTTQKLKTYGGVCKEIWGLCVFLALGSLACYWGQSRNRVFTCLASPPSCQLFSYQPIRIKH